jgi:hypothetical protein
MQITEIILEGLRIKTQTMNEKYKQEFGHAPR